MATDLRVEQVESLRAYTELIEDLMTDSEPLWCRGVGNAGHGLVPSMYRHPSITDIDELLALEHLLVQRFKERSIPYQATPVRLQDKWDVLFVMQHFGAPTRLLDWTENPFIGLFFAVTSARLDPATKQPADRAAVWLYRPDRWNNKALADVSYDRGILSTDEPLLSSYKHNKGEEGDMRVFPVAMYGLHNSARIVAQRGVFTIFGRSTDSLDAHYQAGDYPADALIKVELPETAVHPLRQQLAAIGITDSVVYPDLEGLALELRRFYGFSL
jgi:hypothetical protein